LAAGPNRAARLSQTGRPSPRFDHKKEVPMQRDRWFTGTFDPRWLGFARFLWIVAAVCVIGLNLYGLVLIVRVTGIPCPYEPCFSYYQLSPRVIQQLQAAGLNAGFVLATRLFSFLYSALAWALVALVLFWRKSEEKPVYFISLMLLSFDSLAFGPAAAVDELNIPVFNNLAWFFYNMGQMSFVFLFVFPDGRFTPRWTGFLAGFWALVWFSAFFSRYASPYDTILTTPVLLPFLGSVILAQWVRFRGIQHPLRRQQVKWVVFSTTVALSFYVAYLAVTALVLRDPTELFLLRVVAELTLFIAMGGIPISIGFAMLRYRLWDIDFLIRRTLAYGAVTVLLALVYFGGVFLIQALLRGWIGEESAVAIVASTLAIAALFQPLRRRIQRVIDRRFYRRKYDARLILESFGAAARSEVNLASISDRLLAAAEETMQPESASLWLRQKDPHAHR
jgi:hypothetical protein